MLVFSHSLVLLASLTFLSNAFALGPYPDEISQWDEDTKASQREAGKTMIESIQEAADAGLPEIKIPKGDYRFAKSVTKGRAAHILFRGYSNFTIDFQGSTLWFETEGTGFVTSRVDNLTIKNVVLDWDPLPFMQGVVTNIDVEANTFSVKIAEGYETPSFGMSADKAPKQSGWRGVLFDPETREMKIGQNGFSLYFDWNRRAEDGSYIITYRGFYEHPISESGMAVGDAIVLLKRMGRAIRIEAGKETTLENVTLYSSPFVAIAHNAGFGDHGIVVRGCKVIRRPDTNRLIAGNADGINIANSAANPIIEDCHLEYLGDDFVNIHGHLSRVIWQNSPTEIICSKMNYRGTIKEPVEVEFLDRKTLTSLGRRQVTAVPITWTIDKEQCLADLSHKWHSGEAAGLDYGKKMTMQKLTLNEPIEITGDVIIAVEAYSGSNAIIRNSTFHGSLARGIRMQSPGSLIENNRISHTMGYALSLQGHANFWGEGPYVHSTIIRGNTIDFGLTTRSSKERTAICVSDGDVENQRVSYDITITDNNIFNSPGAAITARGVQGLTLTNNVIDGYGFAPVNDDAKVGANHAIVLQNIGDLVLADNIIQDPGQHATGEIFEQDVSLAE